MPPKSETQVIKDGHKQPPPPPPGFPIENPEKRISKRLFEWKNVAVGAVKSVTVGAVKSVTVGAKKSVTSFDMKKKCRAECGCFRREDCDFF